MYPGPALGGREGGWAATTTTFAAAGSHRYAWPDHGRPSVHTTLGADPGSTADVRRPAVPDRISILDALARLVETTVTGQLVQHNDAPDASPHLRSGSPTLVRRITPRLILVTSSSFDHLLPLYLHLSLLTMDPFCLSP
jgi:hypothetical protein